MPVTDPYWNADTLLEAFQRMVRRQDYWRGYVGWEDDDPSDDEVHGWLQEARDALKRPIPEPDRDDGDTVTHGA